MDRAQLIQAIADLLRRVPKYIASASIDQVREFKKWHSKTSKSLTKSNLQQLQNTYREVMSKYQ